MKPENPPLSEENFGEHNVLTLPIDASLFDRLEGLKSAVGDSEKRKTFETIIEEGKLRAFSYAGEVLDYLAPGTVPKKKEEEEDSHRIANALNTISLGAQIYCDARLDFSPEDSNQHALKLFEAASLQYAFSKLGVFRKRVEEGNEEPDKVAEEMGFPRGLDVGKLSDEFSAKLEKLDPSVRETFWNDSL